MLRSLFGCLFVAVFCFSHSAFAKDMGSRLGVGFKNQSSADIPGVAVQYYPSNEVAVSAEIGVDTQKDNSKFGVIAKIHKIIFKEDNLNFYMGAGGGLLSEEVVNDSGTGTHTNSGFELLGFLGCEFFFQGLDSLGFSFETGAAVTSIASGVRFRTVGDSPVRAGITFYF